MVLDTHIFLWFDTGDPRLDDALRERMEAEPWAVFVPSICFWESLMLVQKGRLDLGPNDPINKLESFMEKTGFKEAPLTSEIAMLSRTLEFNHEDPADRFIAATARAMGLPLATADVRLKSLPWLQTI